MDNIRYCKKCGTELLSTNKGKKCDACKRKTASKIRNVMLSLLAIVPIVPVVKSAKNKIDNRSSDSDDELEDEV